MFGASLFAALALLTDNPKGSLFPDEVDRIQTGCTVDWRSTGEWQADAQMLETSVNASGQSALLNGRIVGDGSYSVWGAWNGGPRAEFTLDLKGPYLISKVILWSAENLALRGISGYTVALGTDGKKFVDVARYDSPADADGGFGAKEIHPVPRACELEKPAVARYVRIRVERASGRHQMVLGEVAVFGELPPGDMKSGAYAPEKCRPCVDLRVDGFSSGAAAFDWAGFPAAGDVKGWRLYGADNPFSDARADGVRLLAELPSKTTTHILFPLVPGVTNCYAVTAVYADGESTATKSVAHAPNRPLEVTRFRDMLGVNYFWGGGGANSKTKAWYDVAADFLATTPFRKIRWWQSPAWAMKEYLPRRIEVCNWTGDIENSRKYGLYMHDMGNEPELNPTTSPESNVATFRQIRAKWLAAGCGDEHIFYGPSVNICERGVEFFKKWIDAGGAEIADAYDFHTYCSNTAEFVYPEGYPSGSPEAIIPAVGAIRDFLRERNLEKPLVCSEWGYSDTRIANPHMTDPSPLRKAQFLVRGCIIHHRLDFKRLFLYSFYDEGSDVNNSEQVFGILTRDLQKKPAYQALETMGMVLGDTIITADMEGLGSGDFGYVFRNVDGPGFVSVIWNGAKERSGKFKTACGDVEIVSLFGERRTIKTKQDGMFFAKYGASPVYFVCSQPVALVSSGEIANASERTGNRLEVSASDACAVFNASETPRVSFQVKNPLARDVEMFLSVRNSRGRVLEERHASIASGQHRTFSFVPDMTNCVLDKFELTVAYDHDGESRSESQGAWVRTLGSQEGGTVVQDVVFANLDHPVVRLSSDELEVTVDPVQGGQILEIYDKRNKTNQLSVDYDRLGGLSVIPYAYCLWSEVSVLGLDGIRAPWPKFRRANRFSARAEGPSLVLTCEDRGILLKETLHLEKDKLSWFVDARNGTDGVAKMRWHIHPEYTIAGLADSYQDYMIIPTDKGDFKLVFWSGLGERKLTDIASGWWRMVDPIARYAIRQDFDRERFDVPKLWFGIGAWNVEMQTKIEEIRPGESLSSVLTWRFYPEGED